MQLFLQLRDGALNGSDLGRTGRPFVKQFQALGFQNAQFRLQLLALPIAELGRGRAARRDFWNRARFRRRRENAGRDANQGAKSNAKQG